jgi:tetratricopeptide (TPR) repeat protein
MTVSMAMVSAMATVFQAGRVVHEPNSIEVTTADGATDSAGTAGRSLTGEDADRWGAEHVETRNGVAAQSVAGVVVQAGTVTGGIHQYAAVQPVPVVPQQLPPCPAAFVGRAEALAQLDAAVDRSASGGPVVISALAGAGGIGKTWLAVHWAHRHHDRFPDGQLFVDLRGFSVTGAPMPVGEAVWGFLHALGVQADLIPADVDARVRLYRSLAAGKRLLVVLDNAADDEQVTPLLPGSSRCTVLVTSRTILTGLITRYGAVPLPVDVLEADEATTLLARRLGAADTRLTAEPDAAAELVRLCGRYPLALTIVAARAQTRRRVPLAEFAAELREHGLRALDNPANPEASLPAALAPSLRDLTTAQREVFALLGIAPGNDIGLFAAASLAGKPVAPVRAALERLEEASLVERHPGSRYRMHDLIRKYATHIAGQALTEPERRDAMRRVVDYFTYAARDAAQVLNPHSPPIRLDPAAAHVHHQPPPGDVPAAVAWLEIEHAGLLAAQLIAVDHGWRHRVGELAWSLTDFHHQRGHRHDRHTVWQTALDATEHIPCSPRRIRALRQLGHALAELGRTHDAIAYLHRALDISVDHHKVTEQAHTHRILAMAWEQRGDNQQALEHATRAWNLFTELDQPVWQAITLNAVGWLTAQLGNYDIARDHCQAALVLHRVHHHPEGEAKTLDSLGYIANSTGHHQQAIDHYQQAINLYRTLGNTRDAANTADRLGHPLRALGQHHHAQATWTAALQLYQQQGRDTDAARVQHHLDTLDRPHQPDQQITRTAQHQAMLGQVQRQEP